MTEAAQGPLHPSTAAALKPLMQLFWREGEADTAIALQRHVCSVLEAEASHAISGADSRCISACRAWSNAIVARVLRLCAGDGFGEGCVQALCRPRLLRNKVACVCGGGARVLAGPKQHPPSLSRLPAWLVACKMD